MDLLGSAVLDVRQPGTEAATLEARWSGRKLAAGSAEPDAGAPGRGRRLEGYRAWSSAHHKDLHRGHLVDCVNRVKLGAQFVSDLGRAGL